MTKLIENACKCPIIYKITMADTNPAAMITFTFINLYDFFVLLLNLDVVVS